MSEMKNYLDAILNCLHCYGKGVSYWGNGEDYEFEYCECNPHNLIIEDKEIIYV